MLDALIHDFHILGGLFLQYFLIKIIVIDSVLIIESIVLKILFGYELAWVIGSPTGGLVWVPLTMI